MRFLSLPLALLVALAGCKAEKPEVAVRSARTVVVVPKDIHDDRQAVGEVKPRYESDLSFRVAGKVLARLVDVGASVKKGDTLATLDTQDFRNRLLSAEADVSSAEAELVEVRATEARKAKLLQDGWTPQANYDTALRNLRSAEARLTSAKANLDVTRDQLHYTELKADFDGVITAVGAEPGQNVNAGQMVLPAPSTKAWGR
jgi:RND family efflux transporter MFP subunit